MGFEDFRDIVNVWQHFKMQPSFAVGIERQVFRDVCVTALQFG
jgi:hypothetical protein